MSAFPDDLRAAFERDLPEGERLIRERMRERTATLERLTRDRTRVAVFFHVQVVDYPTGRVFVHDVAIGRLTWDPSEPRHVRVTADRGVRVVEIPGGAILEIKELEERPSQTLRGPTRAPS
jgi:hypothetical protein